MRNRSLKTVTFAIALLASSFYDYVVNVNSPDYKGPFNQMSCEARVK
ncbi:hypothetical protein C5S53_01645 [Methanophagales archaeon]|nr:hypothetical protein C5S53_01645 [Methanophagales archaeon]